MNSWPWDELASTVGGSWVIESSTDALDFVGVCIDTRDIEPGQLFFAFVGEQADGHAYLEQAQHGGASACVVTHPDRIPDGFTLPALLIQDPQRALNDLASVWRSRLHAKVIAITGSNGKTTTCRLMHSVCANAGKAFASPKSFNNALGVPITVLNTPVDAQFLVAEVGMSTPGEIAQRTKTLRPDIAMITSIGRAHLEALGSIENIAHEKAQLISTAPESAVGVIPSAIESLDAALSDDSHRIIRLPSDFNINDAGFSVPLPGDHNAHNAALCVFAARELGIDDETIRSGLANATPPAMRFEQIEIETDSDPIVIINDAYNANPDSMHAALSTFVSLKTAGPKLIVLGEMLEMGDSGPREHQSLLSYAAGLKGIKRLTLLGSGFVRSVSDDERVEIIAEANDAAITTIASTIASGDTVLIKGSRGVRLERLIAKLSQLHANDRSQSQTGTRTHA